MIKTNNDEAVIIVSEDLAEAVPEIGKIVDKRKHTANAKALIKQKRPEKDE